MQIRHRLTLVFLASVASILGLSFLAIYFLSAEDRKNTYYDRLSNRARTTARLLIEVEEVDADLLLIIDRNTPGILPFERVAVYDYQDQLIYHTDEAEGIAISSWQLDEIRLEESVRFMYNDFEALGLRYEHPEGRFVIVAMAQDVYGLQRLADLRQILWIVLGIGVLISAALGWYFAGRALSPIAQVVERVQQIGASNLDTRVQVPNQEDEIGRMAQTFNAMLDRLEAAFLMQKQFIGNASHELRTPLTSIIGQLEVNRIKPRSAEEYQLLTASILEDMKRLHQLTNRLMLLAQAQSEVPLRNFQSIRIDEIIWRVREDLLRYKKGYRMEVEFEEMPEEEGLLAFMGSEELMYTALFNLAENGCKYAPDHEVMLGLSFSTGEIRIRVSNRGNIQEEDLIHIFEPFYRSRTTSVIPGSGLGLPLAKHIIELHGGRILLHQDTTHVVSVEVAIPVARAE